MLVIHYLVVHLVSGVNSLEDRYTDQSMTCLWTSMESLICCPVMQALYQGSSEPVYVFTLVCHRYIRF